MITKNDDERVSVNEENFQKEDSDVIKENRSKNWGIFLKGWGKDLLKKLLLICIPVAIMVGISTLLITQSSRELDEIMDYEITIEPNKEDASLDIIYDIRWKVLDSSSEGPLTWAKIGTPNKYFTVTALSDNIEKISQYDDTYVRIDFDRSYYQGEEVQFRYKIHNESVAYFENGKYIYDFTPAWFTDAKVDHIRINWLAEGVEKFLPKNLFYRTDEYVILEKNNLKKGEKVNFKIHYAEDFFENAKKYEKSSVPKTTQESEISFWYGLIIFLPYMLFFAIIDFFSSLTYNYQRNRGFRSAGFRYSSPPRSNGRGGFGRWRWADALVLVPVLVREVVEQVVVKKIFIIRIYNIKERRNENEKIRIWFNALTQTRRWDD